MKSESGDEGEVEVLLTALGEGLQGFIFPSSRRANLSVSWPQNICAYRHI
jgi:hypothetical protein